jgi:hypothetical protein
VKESRATFTSYKEATSGNKVPQVKRFPNPHSDPKSELYKRRY